MQRLLKSLFVVLIVPYTLIAQTQQDFDEMKDPTRDTLSNWQGATDGFHASFVSIDNRYKKHVLPKVEKNMSLKLRAWKGERISAQVLLWTTKEADQVEVSLTPFENNKNQLPDSIAKAHFVRYVMTDEFGPGCGYRKPEDFSASLSPDMLDDLEYYNIEKETVRPVWVTIDIPHDAQPGKYHSLVKIHSENTQPKQLQLQIEVLDHLLPKPSEWTYHLDLWQHPAAVARVNDVEMWSDAHFKKLKPIMKRLADAGQKVITTTLNKDPWNVQTYDPYADMIVWTKDKDGSWEYDYSVFDRWVNLMMNLGIDKMINAYSIIPWNEEIHYKDGATGEFVDVKATPGTPEFEEYWSPFLKDFAKHLKQKGWLKKTNIALDERAPEQMEAAFNLINKVTPKLGVSYADNHRTYKKYPESEDVSIAADHPFSKEDLIARREKGLNTTFYVYCGNSFPNQFTFSAPAESTYAAWYALANGFDGMLRWSYNSWVKNPLKDSRFRTWPAGDTYMVYPQNRSSIRFERLQEGVQDYVKARIIKDELKKKGKKRKLKQLKKAIQKLSSDERTADWNQNLNAAKKLLNKKY